MFAFEKVISQKAVRPSGEILLKSPGRLAKGSLSRKEIRFAALGSSCTASSRFAAASWLGVSANEAKFIVAITVGGTTEGLVGSVGTVGITGETGVVWFRNSRTTDCFP